MGKTTTLSRVFQHEGQWYFYDTVTAHLYECDEVVASVVPVLDDIDNIVTRASLDEEWGPARVEAACNEINELQKTTKALTPKELTIIERCPCCHDVSAYETEIQQLQLSVTEQCNLRCRYCPYTEGRLGCHSHNNSYMSVETAISATDFFLDHSRDVEVPAVSFYGGEPLLCLDLIKKVVSRVRQRQGDTTYQIYVDTNGVLIDDQVAVYLSDEQINLQISLDGPQQIHDRYRVSKKGRGSYGKVIAGVKRLLRSDANAYKRIRFNAVMAPPYHVKEVVDFFNNFPVYKEFGIDAMPTVKLEFADLTDIELQPTDEYDIVVVAEELNQLFERYVQACKAGKHNKLSFALRSLFDEGIVKYHHRPRMILPDELVPTACCQPGQRKLHVKADGSYLPCERCGDNMIIGHVDNGIDMNMVHTLHHKLIDAVKDRCRTCWAINRCGVCYSHISATWRKDGKGLVEVPRDQCEAVCSRAERVFREYLTLKDAGPQAMEWLKDSAFH